MRHRGELSGGARRVRHPLRVGAGEQRGEGAQLAAALLEADHPQGEHLHLKISPDELQSILGLVRSQLELTLGDG